MPIYEYECRTCGHRFEVRQSAYEAPLTECVKCSGPVRKVFYPVGVIYKVGGFHITDYVRKGTGEASKAKGNGEKPCSSSECSCSLED